MRKVIGKVSESELQADLIASVRAEIDAARAGADPAFKAVNAWAKTWGISRGQAGTLIKRLASAGVAESASRKGGKVYKLPPEFSHAKAQP